MIMTILDKTTDIETQSAIIINICHNLSSMIIMSCAVIRPSQHDAANVFQSRAAQACLRTE